SLFFFFSSRRRHTRFSRDWSSDVCSSDLHTNIGAAFRAAAGLGADAVLVSPRCADPLYRRSVRVSMGTVFQVPWTRIGEWAEAEIGRASCRERAEMAGVAARNKERRAARP